MEILKILELLKLMEEIFNERLILQGMEIGINLSLHERDKHQGHFDTEYACSRKFQLEAKIADLSKKKAELLQTITLSST